MSDQLDVLVLLAGRLNEAGFEYMVTGSMALNAWAEPRMTRDVDIIVRVDPPEAGRLLKAFGPEFYVPESMAHERVRMRRMFNIIHMQLAAKVDIIPLKQEPFALSAFARRRDVNAEGHELVVASPEDVLLSKLVWARETKSDMQTRDIRNLLAAQRALDWEYVTRWATTLGVLDRLAEIRSDF